MMAVMMLCKGFRVLRSGSRRALGFELRVLCTKVFWGLRGGQESLRVFDSGIPRTPSLSKEDPKMP